MSDDCTNWSNTRKKATCINSANVGWHWHARGPRGRGLGSEKTTPGSIRLAVAARLGSGASGDGGIDPLHAASWPGSCGARVPLHLPREDGTSDPTDRGDARSCTSSGPTRAHLNHSRYRTTCFPGVPPQPKHGTGRDGERNADGVGMVPEPSLLHEAGALLEELGGLAEERPPHCARRQAPAAAVPELVPPQEEAARQHHAKHGHQEQQHRHLLYLSLVCLEQEEEEE